MKTTKTTKSNSSGFGPPAFVDVMRLMSMGHSVAKIAALMDSTEEEVQSVLAAEDNAFDRSSKSKNPLVIFLDVERRGSPVVPGRNSGKKKKSFVHSKENASRLTPDKAVALLKTGKNRAEIAEKFGVSLGTVNKRLWDGNQARTRVGKYDVDEEKVAKSFLSGSTLREIAADFKISETAVRYRLRKARLL